MDPLGILADTLSDALACGAIFALRGARTLVAILPEPVLPKAGAADVLVVAAESAGLSPGESRAHTRAAALSLRQAGWPLGFFLVGRTGASHLAASLEELLTLGMARVWAPAGIGIDSDSLGAACGPVGRIARALLDSGTPAVANQVRFDRARGCRTVLCEAETRQQLRIVARLLRDREIAEPREMLAGTAELAAELAAVLIPDPGSLALLQGKPASPETTNHLRTVLEGIPWVLAPASAPYALTVDDHAAPAALRALSCSIVEIAGHAKEVGETFVYLSNGPHAGLPVAIRHANVS